MKDFNIRFALPTDSQLILDFIKGIADYENMSDEVEGTAEDILTTIFEERCAEVLIGEEKGVPVGFALFFHNYSTFKAKKGLYLEDLYILPEKRGKGYGTEFFKRLISIARDRNCGRMEWACLDWNEPSIAFYKSMGAAPMDTWTTYRLNEEQLKNFDKDK